MPERKFRLWDRDWKTVVLETSDYAAAEQFLRASGFDWLPMQVDWGTDWKQRWGGRLELAEDGTVSAHDELSYLKYTTTWPELAADKGSSQL